MRTQVLTLLMLVLTACAPAATLSTPSRTGITPEVSPAVRPSETATVTATEAAASPSETIPPKPLAGAGCLETKGRTFQLNVESTSLPRALPIQIYLPPCYGRVPGSAQPTLYLLHGLGADNSQWPGLGITDAADSLISSGEASPFVIVMPSIGGGIPAETAVAEVLVPYIDGRFRVLAEPTGRALGGLSRGGGWAFRIGFKHPELFGAVGLHSPAVFEADRGYVYFWIRDGSAEDVPRLWIDIGDRDSLLTETQTLLSRLEELQIPFTWTLNEGTHTEEYWAKHLETYLRWYARAW